MAEDRSSAFIDEIDGQVLEVEKYEPDPSPTT